MRIAVIAGALIVSLASASLSVAQEANRAAIEKQIIANERAINDAFAKGDTKTFSSMVAPEGFGIDPGGVMKLADYVKMISQVKIDTWNMDNMQVTWLSPDVALHTYRWTGKGTFAGQPIPSPTYASTIWVNKGGKWLPVFHQETAAGPPPSK